MREVEEYYPTQLQNNTKILLVHQLERAYLVMLLSAEMRVLKELGSVVLVS